MARSRASEYAQAAGHACRAMCSFAGIFPIGRPRALFWQGHYHWLLGLQRRADRLWQQCADLAHRMGMSYEMDLARAALMRHISPGHPQRDVRRKPGPILFD